MGLEGDQPWMNWSRISSIVLWEKPMGMLMIAPGTWEDFSEKRTDNKNHGQFAMEVEHYAKRMAVIVNKVGWSPVLEIKAEHI